VVILAAEGAGTLHSRIWMAAKHKVEVEQKVCPSPTSTMCRTSPTSAGAPDDNRLKAIDAMFRKRFGVRLGAIIIDTISAACVIEKENDAGQSTP